MEGPHRAARLALISLLPVLAGCAGLRVTRVFADRLSPRSAAELLESAPVVVVDLRPAEDFSRSHLPGAVSIPVRGLSQAFLRLPEDAQTPILVYDQDGRASEEAALWLVGQGYDAVAEVAGGLDAWRAARLPVEGVEPGSL